MKRDTAASVAPAHVWPHMCCPSRGVSSEFMRVRERRPCHSALISTTLITHQSRVKSHKDSHDTGSLIIAFKNQG